MSTAPIAAALVWLVLAPGLRAAEPATATGAAEAERVLFLIEYIGSDYAGAVRDGAIADPFEYAEMQEFGKAVLEGATLLSHHGAQAPSLALIRDLELAIRRMRPAVEVRDLATRLAARLLDELDVVSLPATPPDLRRGARFYQEGCAPCHGVAGAADGRATPALDPQPISLRGAAMDLVSPHQVFSAVAHGIEGTAMPSYGWALDRAEMWDVAFFVMTLRDIPDVRSDDPGLGLSVHDLARASNQELLARVRHARPDAGPRDVDYYRRHVPVTLLAGPPPPGTTAPPALGPPPGAGADLGVALQLQASFAEVAERVFPSVVTVSAFVRDDPAAKPKPERDEHGWSISSDELIYPGFHRVQSGSGFVVSDEGHVLTESDILIQPDGTPVAVVDLELHTGEHVLGHVVGLEPTIHLGVVRRDLLTTGVAPSLPKVKIGDSDRLRVGHWTIALGDPWGPGTSYSVGLLASEPQRQCYQDQLSATLLQSTVTLPPEACGGPLVNIHGEVVGLNLRGTPGLAAVGTAALPINLALNIYEALKVKESVRSPWLGLSVLEIAAARRTHAEPIDPDALARTGVYIDNVFQPSPAARAGIQVGDCLVSIDGHRLFSVADFQKWMYLSGVGREVTLEIYRAGKTLEPRVTIEQRPPDAVPR
jgi:S1-C subfamily serine protease/mono/diheme cytochrome c family protein